MQADLTRDRIDLLVVVLLEIDDPVLTETRDWCARLRIEGDQPVTRA